MNRPLIHTAPAVILFFAVNCPNLARADITIGGVTFADNAFADVVLDATPSGSGQFNKETSGGSQSLTLPTDFAILQAAVVGPDVNEWISLRTSQAHLTVGFTDVTPINGPGNDIAIVEIGQTAAVSVTIEGVTNLMHSQAAGTVNMIFIDLADFGVAHTSAVMVSSSDIFNDIAAFGVINGVPEPSSVVLGALGLVSLAGFAWRKMHCALLQRWDAASVPSP